MQLERLLQRQGFGTRKECRALVRHGRVRVAGQACDDPFAEIPPAPDLIFSVDGVEWPWQERAVLMLHKPVGHECSRKPKHHPSVLELLPRPLRERGVQPVGRLDEDTTGLLILTDDGALNHRLSSPRKKLPKVYCATTADPLGATQIAALLAGVVLDDDPQPVAAAGAVMLAPHTLRLTLTQGKYHQVKRMVAAVGNRVTALHREAIGGLALPTDLAPGAWAWLSPAELERLEHTP
ncbi:MAG: 16S rRNA pseudouridine(516) synthase [Azonexus sp.]|nr:16S rRNA pseudouridine(516) synthase [Betaproteobacteria bacterium]MBK8919653.1 16S rRNA pseudouridine(516) synthase [Betaproteobacteria bacterium]MBP6034894.1 16S rRNA pseudouridine(516) synthase [Azonexus sp.]MBP6905600.1 16S rRNA pseudouridine(516) synthase [Azonexus sp.]